MTAVSLVMTIVSVGLTFSKWAQSRHMVLEYASQTSLRATFQEDGTGVGRKGIADAENWLCSIHEFATSPDNWGWRPNYKRLGKMCDVSKAGRPLIVVEMVLLIILVGVLLMWSFKASKEAKENANVTEKGAVTGDEPDGTLATHSNAAAVPVRSSDAHLR